MAVYNSRYLISGGNDSKIMIWTLGETFFLIKTLDGHRMQVNAVTVLKNSDRHTEVFSLLLDLKNNFNFFYKFWIGLGIGLFFSVKKNLSIFESLKTIYQNRDDFSIILKPKRYFWWENYLRTFLFFIRPKERSLMAQWQQIEYKREKTTAKIGDLVLVWTVDELQINPLA